MGRGWPKVGRGGSEDLHEWEWLTRYLGLLDDPQAIRATFPDDAPLRAAVAFCPGLRVLRQEPWECLASFILSSTKQIVQIQQCVAHLCERFGERVAAPPDAFNPFAFPTAANLAAASEAELRACKIGFRAKYLRAAATLIASGELDLAALPNLPLPEARAELMRCPGVGPKIADCALLFSCGFDAAFPIDVWVERALRQLYFPRRCVKRKRLEQFAATHFGPHAGHAQQFLFHYLRTSPPS
jgi:N-glycosylase/DNA lyase